MASSLWTAERRCGKLSCQESVSSSASVIVACLFYTCIVLIVGDLELSALWFERETATDNSMTLWSMVSMLLDFCVSVKCESGKSV